jgi:hypothetical protein
MQSFVMSPARSGKWKGYRGRDGFSAVETAGDEDQELGEQIGFGRETISGENCGIERGVGGFEWVDTGEFGCAIERPQAAFQFRQ